MIITWTGMNEIATFPFSHTEIYEHQLNYFTKNNYM